MGDSLQLNLFYPGSLFFRYTPVETLCLLIRLDGCTCLVGSQPLLSPRAAVFSLACRLWAPMAGILRGRIVESSWGVLVGSLAGQCQLVFQRVFYQLTLATSERFGLSTFSPMLGGVRLFNFGQPGCGVTSHTCFHQHIFDYE